MILTNIESLINVCEEEQSTAKKWAKRALIGGAIGTAGLAGAAKLGLLGQNAQNMIDDLPGNIKAGAEGFRAGQLAYDATHTGDSNKILDRTKAGWNIGKLAYGTMGVAQNFKRQAQMSTVGGAADVLNAYKQWAGPQIK
jgi:hypothetical protein